MNQLNSGRPQHKRVPQRGVPRRVALGLAVSLMLGVLFYRGFLPLADAAEDGFQAQILNVALLLADGTFLEASTKEPLIWVHLTRLISASPFWLAETAVGTVGSLALVMLLLVPLIRYPDENGISPLIYFPFFLPLVLSGRSVLVAAGVGYLLIFLLRPSAPSWTLWLGTLFVNLSSASVMASILLIIFLGNEKKMSRGQRRQKTFALLILLLSFAASILDKMDGFARADVGYAAHAFSTDNVLLMVLSRSTLIVSFFEGHHLRAFAYLGIASIFMVKLFSQLSKSNSRTGLRLMLCCLPGIFMEGSGVWALFFPLLWLVAGWRRDLETRTSKSRSKNRSIGLQANQPMQTGNT
ncbi:hypothetical protein ACS5PK_03990 [Roseateles sp. DB2]|uniref:hypothetical protein n=1 Tax=Roseateles sp. DB2 TaxID=3453717 RepID=UPI003EEB0BE4